jgi:nucleoid DNA-binding protein
MTAEPRRISMSPDQRRSWVARAALLAIVLLPFACAPADEPGPAGERARDTDRPAGKARPGRQGGARPVGLAAAVAERTGQRQSEAAAAVDAVFEEVEARLAAGQSVRVPEFGTFTPVRRPARTARKPGTDEVTTVPESVGVRFRPGKRLKEAVAAAPIPAPERPAKKAAPAAGAEE